VTLYVLRHARAGRRSAWKGADEERPLSRVGRRQAVGIVDLLRGLDIAEIVTSPYLRCRESVEPLAERLGLPVDLADELAEGVDLQQILRLTDKVIDGNTVLCTHGDVMRLLLEHLRSEGVKVRRRNGAPLMEKGSMWVLETRRGRVVKATYQRPPRTSGSCLAHGGGDSVPRTPVRIPTGARPRGERGRRRGRNRDGGSVPGRGEPSVPDRGPPGGRRVNPRQPGSCAAPRCPTMGP